jgi:hypothetical protein
MQWSLWTYVTALMDSTCRLTEAVAAAEQRVKEGGEAGGEDLTAARQRVAALGIPLERLPAFLQHMERTLPIAETHWAEQRRRAAQMHNETSDIKAALEARLAARKEAEMADAARAAEAKASAQAAAKALQEKLTEQIQSAPDAENEKENIKSAKARAKKRQRVEEGDDEEGHGALLGRPSKSFTSKEGAESESESSDSSSDSSTSSEDDSSSSSSGDSEAARKESAKQVAALFGEDEEVVGDEGKGTTVNDIFGEEDEDGLEPAADVPEPARKVVYKSESESEGSAAEGEPQAVSGRKRKAAVLDDDED